MKKILVVTMTKNRLETTRKYIGELALKAGYDFKHIVVDNGSKDGTVEYLKETGYEVVENKENEGIIRGWIRGVDFAIEQGFIPDYIVKFDDDCEIKTEDILKQIMEFYEENGDKYIVAPINLKTYPKNCPEVIDDKKRIGSFNVRITALVGGRLKAMSYDAFKLIAEHKVEMDIERGKFWRKKGYSPVYLIDLKTIHRGEPTDRKTYKF